MSEESFILVSLKENKAKRLAQVISNETSRKILDCLAKKEYTESDLSKELKLPISTVHYNLQHLVENRLVLADEFHYSQKGREVIHYKLAKKLIVIAPQDMDESSIAQALKSIIPVGVFVLVATGILSFLKSTTKLFAVGTDSAKSFAVNAVAKESTRAAGSVAKDQIVASAPSLQESVVHVADDAIVQPIVAVQNEPNLVLWFFAGAVFTLIVTFLVLWLRSYLKHK